MSLFNEMNNSGCTKCHKIYMDSNNGLCKITNSVDDLFPVRCVGEWGKDKISFLSRYIDIVGKSMYDKWRLNYIEVCSGPGRCIDRDHSEEFDGSPLAVLKKEGAKNYSNFLFIDYDETVVDFLKKRIESSKELDSTIKSKVKVLKGDYNKPIELMALIKENTKTQHTYGTNFEYEKKPLNTLFIDPTDLSVPFDTLLKLSRIDGKIDLIINEAIYSDFNRNSKVPFLFENSKAEEKWERVLGIPGFFKSNEYLKLAKMNDIEGIRRLFHSKYVEQLNSIGYTCCQEAKISNLYYLLLASSNPLAVEFWKKACMLDGGGQKELNF